jgi:hypothetical protein
MVSREYPRNENVRTVKESIIPGDKIQNHIFMYENCKA